MEEMKSNLNRVADAVKYLTRELNKNPGDFLYFEYNIPARICKAA